MCVPVHASSLLILSFSMSAFQCWWVCVLSACAWKYDSKGSLEKSGSSGLSAPLLLVCCCFCYFANICSAHSEVSKCAHVCVNVYACVWVCVRVCACRRICYVNVRSNVDIISTLAAIDLSRSTKYVYAWFFITHKLLLLPLLRSSCVRPFALLLSFIHSFLTSAQQSMHT